MRADSICVVEPQMYGMVHAPFNAALLHTVLLAYPAVPVSFHAMPSHMDTVREILAHHAPGMLARLACHAFQSPASSSIAARWYHSRRLLRSVLALQQRTLFCSISRMQLLLLQRMVRRRKAATVRVVVHGELDQLEHAPPSSAPARFFSLQRALAGEPLQGLRYLLLGRSIANNIPPEYRGVLGGAGVFDHPYHFAEPAPPVGGLPVFGVFGTAAIVRESRIIIVLLLAFAR